MLLRGSHDLTSYHRNTTLLSESSFHSKMTKRWCLCKQNADPKDGLQPGVPSTTVLSLRMFISLLLLRLLYSVLPPSVANELRHKRPVPAKRYDNVTILFSGIVGFNAFCSKHASAEGAIKIVNLLNDVYTRFDILTDSRKNPYVYKVRSRNFTIM